MAIVPTKPAKPDRADLHATYAELKAMSEHLRTVTQAVLRQSRTLRSEVMIRFANLASSRRGSTGSGSTGNAATTNSG